MTDFRMVRRRVLPVFAVIALSAVVLVACAPEPPPPPAQNVDTSPSTSTTSTSTSTTTVPPSSACNTLGANEADPVPTPQQPVDYVAVVEKPDGTLETATFRADTPTEKDAVVGDIARTEGEIVAVEPDGEVQALVIDDPEYSGTPGQWWVDRAGFEAAWGPSLAQGAGVRVAIVDTGVTGTHPDLGAHVVAGVDELDPSVVGDERTDTGTHGTHVAGIAGALDNQIGGIGGAPGVTIVPVRVLNGTTGSLSDVIDGVLWAANPALGDADVINLSMGSASCSDAMFEALEYAVGQGVTVVAAAGNCGCSTQEVYPAAFSTVIDGVIAVAATNESDARASFSNFNSYVSIAAPGNGILSTLPPDGYGTKSGTSMATPVVAAAAALVKAKCPAYGPVQVKNRLFATVEDLGPAGWDPSFGAGLVRADQAVAGPC